MANLIARSPCQGLLPVELGNLRITEILPQAITWISPFRGKSPQVSVAFKDAVGVALPASNRSTAKAGIRALWVGPDQTLVLGPPVRIEFAAIVDQSSGWACIELDGGSARDVLARLVPVDLREGAFKRGHTARTLLNHMTVSLTRTGAERFEILVFRSMARTAVHELSEAMEKVAARDRA